MPVQETEWDVSQSVLTESSWNYMCMSSWNTEKVKVKWQPKYNILLEEDQMAVKVEALNEAEVSVLM